MDSILLLYHVIIIPMNYYIIIPNIVGFVMPSSISMLCSPGGAPMPTPASGFDLLFMVLLSLGVADYYYSLVIARTLECRHHL